MQGQETRSITAARVSTVFGRATFIALGTVQHITLCTVQNFVPKLDVLVMVQDNCITFVVHVLIV